MTNNIDRYFKDLWQQHDEPWSSNVSIDDNAFPAFLEVDLRGDEIEVPFFLLSPIIRVKFKGYDKLVYNLVNGYDNNNLRTFRHKTINTILGKFIEASESPIRIAHIVTSKNLHYYGNHGIILDQNYNPLFVATIMLKIGNGTPKIYHPTCKLSYKVFENSQEIVEKTIIKQAIPMFSSCRANVDYSHYNYEENVELSITNLESMVIVPNRPTMVSASTNAFNSIILNNYDNP